MSVAVIIVAVITAIATVSAFLTGIVLGYGMRVREEQDAYKDERIKSALKHWRGHTDHRGCTIFSPGVKEWGIR